MSRLLAHARAKLHASKRGETCGDHKPQDHAPSTPADEALINREQGVPQRDGEVPPGKEAGGESGFGQLPLGQYIQR